jgi:hypothetical protein
MTISAGAGVSATLVQPAIYRDQTTPETAAVGDLWVDMSTNPPVVKKCTVAPNTFVSIEGGGGGGGGGTVTSVNVSGGTTGLTFSGGPVTLSGTITAAGTLAVTNGGTGTNSLTGLVKGTGTTAMVAATVRLDYAEPTNALATGLLKNTTTTGAHSIAVPGTDFVVPGTVASSGLTMATSRILGRTTASSGAVEEITVGTGLTLSGGILSSSVTGTVTTLSVVSANGFAGTVANATTTPAITLTTSITGILQGNGTAISAATTTGTGSVVLNTSPAFATTMTLGTLGYTGSGTLASFQSSVNGVNQFIARNSNAGATASNGFVVNNDSSTDTTFYGEFGINSSGYTGSNVFNTPNGVYLTAVNGPLLIGTLDTNNIRFVVNNGTTAAMTITGTTGAVSLGVPLAVTSGGTGTATPSLVAGTNVTISGTWPNQTVNSTGGGGGTVSVGKVISYANTQSLT